MVKNVNGGKHKNQARKHVTNVQNKKLRLKEEEDEMYACVKKKLGDNKLDLLCIDGKVRLGIIPGKLKNKRGDNNIDINTWLLIGIRSWETIPVDKKEKCDVLEVYSDAEKKRLQNNVDEKWSALNDYTSPAKEDEIVCFMNEHEVDLNLNYISTGTSISIMDEEINIDDI